MRRAGKLIAGLFVLVVVGLVVPGVALAFDVTTTTDETTTGDGCSLREAILQANGTAEPDCTTGTASTINVPAGTYTLSMGQLPVAPSSSLAIAGAGASSTTIDANFASRAFDVSAGDVTISGMTIEDGNPGGLDVGAQSTACPAYPDSEADGGAILDSSPGTVTLSGDTFTSNWSAGNGGAVENNGGGTLTVEAGSVFEGNHACGHNVGFEVSFPVPGNGGAIDDVGGGTDDISFSTVSTNTADGDGGGISESAVPGPFDITNTTISDNHANGDGGGVAGVGGGVITLFADLLTGNSATGDGGGLGGFDQESVTNSTITGNFAGCPVGADCQNNQGGSGNGGGIDSKGGPVTASFSTITGNGAVGGSGGNLYANGCGDCGPTGSIALDDSIVSGGKADGDPVNCDGGGISSSGYNLFFNKNSSNTPVDDSAGCGADTSNHDITNADPKLGPLNCNAGPNGSVCPPQTETEALLSGSPAIDHANPNAIEVNVCASKTHGVDQRGVARPQGSACDIGAYEFIAGGGGGGTGKTTPTVSTTVFDADTNHAWAGTETAGASAYDTSDLGGTVQGNRPSGSVTYSLFDNGNCSREAMSTNTEPLNEGGSVPHSTPTGPLTAGSYSYEASYSGDGSYTSAVGPCEPFTVGQATSQGPDLRLTASAETNPIVVGEQDIVTDTITNNGGSGASNVQFTDPAAGFTIGSATVSQGSCTHTATTVSCSLGALGAGQSATVEIRLTGTSRGKITLNSSVSMNQNDPTPADNSRITTIRVKRHTKPLADLAISVTASATPVSVGHTFTYTLLVSNHGPDAARDVLIKDRLPGKVTLLSAHTAGSAIGCSGTALVRCHLAVLEKFATRRIRLRVRANQAGLARDVARVSDASPTDPNLRNNVDRARVDVLSGPAVSLAPLARACYPERSRIAIRARAIAPAGIKRFTLSAAGHVLARFSGHKPAPTHHTLRAHLPGATFLVGRTYAVTATVSDTLGQSARAKTHFTMCQSGNKRGFTG